MGKSILIITLGVSLIIGFIILKINTNATSGVEATMNKFDQTHARLIANSGIEIFLEKLKLDPSMSGSYNGNSLFNGSYNITINGPASLVKVSSVASFMGVNHTSIAEARADGLPFPDSTAAMYLTAGAVSGIKKKGAGGSITINGYNHNINGGQITPIVNPKYGIGVDGEVQKAAVINQIKDQALDSIKGRDYIYNKDPDLAVPSVGIVGYIDFDWDDYARQLAKNPDIQIPIPDGQDSPLSWGTIAKPKVTFVNAASENKNGNPYIINASDVQEGCGILVINGAVTFKGNFTFRGLVIAYKETDFLQDVEVGGTGSPVIIGSLVAAGDKVTMLINGGNMTIKYSEEALSRAESVAVRRFEILSWWE